MKQSTYNSLKSFIWGIANDCLVDVYDVGDYRKIILPMFVIRRFDEVLEPTHDAVVAAKKKFEATGKAGQGPSNLRRYIFEQDLCEAIVAIPENMFYNTGIGTYLWVLTNKKEENGQFVINKMKAWQGSYGLSVYDGIVSPAYYVFDLKFRNKEFFHWAIRSKIYVNFFAQYSDGIRVEQWDLSKEKLKTIPFLVPPENEQAEIVEFLKEQSERIEEQIKSIETEIELLQELRTKIIADVVTGQIDVSDVVVSEYSRDEDTDSDDIEDDEEIEESED